MTSSVISADEMKLVPKKHEIDILYRKITLRFIPLLFLCYLFAFLDRVNVGYAKIQMAPMLKLTESQYGFAAGIFFLSYILFEIPANMLFERIGAKKVFLRIMVLWGLASATTMFVTTAMEFYIIRFLLGIFEAGFFPGLLFYLTLWYPSSRRARVTSYIMLAIQVAGLLGGPVSGAIMSGLDGLNGWAGWQWLFLFEAVPVPVLGVLCYFILVDNPSEAAFLTSREKALVMEATAPDESTGPEPKSPLGVFGRVLTDPQSYVLAFVYFASGCAAYTFNFWLPTIIKNLGVSSMIAIGMYSFIPYLFSALGVLVMGWRSDRARERRWHYIVCALVAAVSLSVVTQVQGSFVLAMTVLCVFGFAINGAIAIFWTVLTTYMPRSRAAVGIAFVSAIGNIAGFLSPIIIGSIRDMTGSFDLGLYFFSLLVVLAALAMLWAVPASAVRVTR